MTAAFLQAELASLIQDSKRKQSDVRTAAEKSLADLKAIQVTSETQLGGDLLRRPQFIDPFILACKSKYVKLAVTGAICLQRMVASKAISPTRLADVLDAFQEATQQGLDVQLKILQALPSLLQLYATDLQGDALGKTLSLCASLAGSKTAMVSSTAIATFQQLIAALFDKHVSANVEENSEEGAVTDIANVFNDMCMVVCSESPQFLRSQGLTVPLALEVVELSLLNEKWSILEIPSCLETCRSFLLPGLVQLLDKSTSFSTFGQCLKILYTLTTTELDRVLESLSEPFSTMLSTMDRPSGPSWRRILCLEFMRNLVSDSQLLRAIYASFDCEEDKIDVITDLMSILVRIAAEDPALIGLGRQSTIPTNTENEIANTGGAHVDIDAVGSVLQASSNVTGISSQWSTMTSPLLEQLDKQAIPVVPETYVYTLVLGCVAALSDGLSKYIMPLSVPSRASLETMETVESDVIPTRKNSSARRAERYQRLLNPLKRDDIANKEEALVCANLIENCWPAILATCSTFLNSALDSYFYHILVRTVQKLAQVSGVLELFTPRDALLTTLAKVSVPLNASSMVTALHGSKLARVSREEDGIEGDDASSKSAIPTTPRVSVDVSRQQLNVRNLLCLRALLNLGIALGPTLSETSWFIIIQSLQQADALMSVNPATKSIVGKSQTQDSTDAESQTNLGSEITAVGTASKRMFESTRTYSDDIFEVFLRSVFKMIETLTTTSDLEPKSKAINGEQKLAVTPQKHKASRSVSGVPATATVLHIEAEFVLKTINDLARTNLYRFCSSNSRSCSWQFVAARLLSIVGDTGISPQLRLQAGGVLNTISMESIRLLEKQEKDAAELDSMQQECLSTLHRQLSLLYRVKNVQSVLSTDVELHRRLLEALENTVSHSGDSLTSGWRTVFQILQKTTSENGLHDNTHEEDLGLILERTVPPAFRTVQLIVSDFLNTIDPVSFSILVQLLPSFGTQKNDLNIALTTTVLFSNLSSLLLERAESINITLSSPQGTDTASSALPVTKRKPTDVSSLWFTIVLQLCLLCKDYRSEVRNSALQVLVRILQSSSSQLTPSTWNVIFQEATLPTLETFTTDKQNEPSWHSSYTQLLQGIVSLFGLNIEIIVLCDDFATTWKTLVEYMNIKLKENSLDGHTIVFSSTAELLKALHTTGEIGEDFIVPVLRFWSENHPARISVEDKSNQDALRAHAQLFTAISKSVSIDLSVVSIDQQSLIDLIVAATRQAILASIHSQYSSDVIKLGPEQAVIANNLKIIAGMMTSNKLGYSNFLLDLISNAVMRNTASEQQTIEVRSKSLKRPTLIAFMSECIKIFRELIKREATNSNMLKSTSASHALVVLTKVVMTKYTNVPVNTDSPAWQNATAAITELTEAARSHVDHIEEGDAKILSTPLAHALEAIVNAPSLEDKEPPPPSETITSDESFDLNHLERFHQASIPILQLLSFDNQARKQYIIALFHASLIAKAWFGDLPSNLVEEPLAKFKEVRPGSIRPPDFLPRTRIPYEALNALLALVDCNSQHNSASGSTVLAEAAAPYVLLRIAHSIKVFLADQQLRNLIPPPRPLLQELNIVLTKAVKLRVVDDSIFSSLMSSTSRHGSLGGSDGKMHLRLLYPLILRLKEFWLKLPRLKVCAWQDTEDGKAVVDALDQWGTVLAEEWEVDVS